MWALLCWFYYSCVIDYSSHGTPVTILKNFPGFLRSNRLRDDCWFGFYAVVHLLIIEKWKYIAFNSNRYMSITSMSSEVFRMEVTFANPECLLPCSSILWICFIQTTNPFSPFRETLSASALESIAFWFAFANWDTAIAPRRGGIHPDNL